ncbi:bola-like protein [Exidia glandulosa HHB12029]|uniref:Bola-like protein n=1 Tax=Exidia glandulosa HHB12029 TaxID=1314781 RepID=A0A165E1E2_EXIGL|nr:bola-like protein [Exidia glandulosa HHB12029]
MSTAAAAASGGPVETAIRTKLTETLNPTELAITNDSWQHRHHHAMRETGGGNGETHFSIQVVSDAFAGKSMMQRHRMIYGALAEEMQQGLHALSLKTKTPEEVAKAAAAAPSA